VGASNRRRSTTLPAEIDGARGALKGALNDFQRAGKTGRPRDKAMQHIQEATNELMTRRKQEFRRPECTSEYHGAARLQLRIGVRELGAEFAAHRIKRSADLLRKLKRMGCDPIEGLARIAVIASHHFVQTTDRNGPSATWRGGAVLANS